MNQHMVQLSRSIKQILMMLADGIMIISALAFSFLLLRIELLDQGQIFYSYLLVATCLSVLGLVRIGLYREVVLYLSLIHI